MSISEDMRAFEDEMPEKTGYSRLYLKSGYAEIPDRLKIMDTLETDESCEYLGALEVSKSGFPVMIFRCPYSSVGNMPLEFINRMKNEYFIKYPNIKNEIEESKKKDKISIALGIFVMQQGKIRYPYGIKIYKEEEKKKCSIRQMIQKKFGWN